jgi:outer membrane lipoprotein SlyB
MKNKFNSYPHLPRLIAGIAVILFNSAGIAHIVGWNPILGGDAGNALQSGADSFSAVKVRCEGCGVIVSMREIEMRDESAGFDATSGAASGNQNEMRGRPTKRHELTIRLADGSSRVISEANSARWRLGEHVVVIGGLSSSNQ